MLRRSPIPSVRSRLSYPSFPAPLRSHCTRPRRQAVGEPQAGRHRGEPTGRRRQSRCRSRRQICSRWAHATRLVGHNVHGESEPLQEAAVRSERGLQVHFDFGEIDQHAGRAFIRTGQFGGRVRRLCEEAAHQLRPWRPRHARPFVHGIFPPACRLPDHTGALSGQYAIGDRPRCRPDQVRLRRNNRRNPARARGPIERPRGIDRQALTGRAGRADDRRIRLSRFRIRDLLRAGGAGRHSRIRSRRSWSTRCSRRWHRRRFRKDSAHRTS